MSYQFKWYTCPCHIDGELFLRRHIVRSDNHTIVKAWLLSEEVMPWAEANISETLS